MTIIFDGVIIRNVFDYNFINVEVAGLISNILDVPDTDEDMRKDEPPKFRIFSIFGAGSADKICRTVTYSDGRYSQEVASSH